ncbi:MAG: SUMF1/EgtB/PvdO family nonheme iron enzyme [Polyangiaceae bacterium]|nr:SUMF1/EgtB/PvdO family nonheme iron enzyme [Polyangiaceae bacterium]
MKVNRLVEAIVIATVMPVMVLVGCSQTKEDIKSDPPVSATEQPGNQADEVDKASVEDGSVDKEWACPKGTRGSSMVLIPVSEGVPYCIDANLATYGDYKWFVEKQGNDFGGQPPECEWNKDWGPVSTWKEPGVPDMAPRKCGPSLTEADPNLSLHCIDFCDAWAFCTAMGKRLCGLRGADNSKVSFVRVGDWYESGTRAEELVITVESEWFNVCSQGGNSKYPYGDEVREGVCVDKSTLADRGDSAYLAGDSVGSECKGSTPPYDQVYNMSGGRSQWVNVCYDERWCFSHAGQSAPETLSCETMGSTSMRAFQRGVRCCANAVPGTAAE